MKTLSPDRVLFDVNCRCNHELCRRSLGLSIRHMRIKLGVRVNTRHLPVHGMPLWASAFLVSDDDARSVLEFSGWIVI